MATSSGYFVSIVFHGVLLVSLESAKMMIVKARLTVSVTNKSQNKFVQCDHSARFMVVLWPYIWLVAHLPFSSLASFHSDCSPDFFYFVSLKLSLDWEHHLCYSLEAFEVEPEMA